MYYVYETHKLIKKKIIYYINIYITTYIYKVLLKLSYVFFCYNDIKNITVDSK